MDDLQKRPSVFDRLGNRVSDDGQPVQSESASHVSVIVSAPPAAATLTRKQSTSSESGSCTTTDEEDTIQPEPVYTGKTRGIFNRNVNINQRRVSSPTLSKSVPYARISSLPSTSRDRSSLTPPHLKDRKGLMYDRHGNLRVPLSEKIKMKSETSRPNSSSPSTTSSSGTNRKTVSLTFFYQNFHF